MSKRKIFGISPELVRGFTETVNIVENNNGIFRNTIIPLSRIELDPDNPRKLFITREDVTNGLQRHDTFYKEKSAELEALKGLANTIEQQGLIQPIAVYKHEDKYRVVAGNRRCLASMIAGKSEIEARVFNEKPSKFALKLVQLIENTAREDLNLKDRLENIRVVIAEYKKEKRVERITPELLRELTGLSLTQAKNYLYVLNAPADVEQVITIGKISSLDKAVLIANIAQEGLRKQVLEKCLAGCSLVELRKAIEQGKVVPSKMLKTNESRGRVANRVNLGATKNTAVAKFLLETLVAQPVCSQYQQLVNNLNWQDYGQVTKAFAKLLQLLESTHA